MTHRLELGVGLIRFRPSCCQELLLVEVPGASHYKIGRTAELERQDAQRLSLAMFPGLSRQILLALRVLAEIQHGRLGKGPLEMDVSDLGAAGSHAFAG